MKSKNDLKRERLKVSGKLVQVAGSLAAAYASYLVIFQTNLETRQIVAFVVAVRFVFRLGTFLTSNKRR